MLCLAINTNLDIWLNQTGNKIMYAEIQNTKLPSFKYQVEQKQTQAPPDDSHIPSYVDIMKSDQEEFQPVDLIIHSVTRHC